MKNVLIIWEVESENEKEICVTGYNVYFSLQEAVADMENFPEKYIIQIGKEEDFWWCGWF